MIPLKDNLRCAGFPSATLTIIALNFLCFIVQILVKLEGSAGVLTNFMLTPAKVTHAFAAGDPMLIFLAVGSIFTCMFMHAGWMHLIGNMLFLFAFGRSMEARLGTGKFILFYLLGGLAAAALQIFSDP